MKTIYYTLPTSKRIITYHIGKNAKENTEVLIPSCAEEDLWFHAENESSCHVVALMQPHLQKKEKHQLIKYGAYLCKYYTNKLRNEDEVVISFTRVKNLKTLCIPGMVEYTYSGSIII